MTFSPEAKGRFLVEPQKKYPQAERDRLSFLEASIFRNCMMPDTKVWATLTFGPCHFRSKKEGSDHQKHGQNLTKSQRKMNK